MKNFKEKSDKIWEVANLLKDNILALEERTLETTK